MTGAGGRLGQALLRALPAGTAGWGRAEIDLDRPGLAVEALERERPSLLIHAAAMTDVDACAREPELAMRRNGDAVGVIAEACVGTGTRLVVISTNEVFDGERDDGQGYTESDPTQPRNAYGASKRAGEQSALHAFGGQDGLWIVRTAWLFGPPGADFPRKIVAASDRLGDDEPLPVVADEHGCPTSTRDLADAIVALVARSNGGLFHLVNSGHTTRLGWATRVLATLRPGRPVRPIRQRDYVRPSDPPPWGVLDPSLAARVAGVTLRTWESALDADLERWAQDGWSDASR